MKFPHKCLALALHAAIVLGAPVAWAADKVYVANEGANTVSVLEATTLKTLGRLPVGKMPHNIQVSPDGRFAWVTNNGEPDASPNAAAHGAIFSLSDPGR